MTELCTAECECFVRINAEDCLKVGTVADKWHPNSWPDFSDNDYTEVVIDGHLFKVDGNRLITVDGKPMSNQKIGQKFMGGTAGEVLSSRLRSGMPLHKALMPPPKDPDVLSAVRSVGCLKRPGNHPGYGSLHGATPDEMWPKGVAMNNHFLRVAMV